MQEIEKSTLTLKILQRLAIAWAVVVLSALSLPAFSNPVINNVAAGDVTIQQTATTTIVNQTSAKGIVNWQSFNIGASESTHFQQPTGGVTFNRINPQQGASEIYGKLTATGQIILINPAGIYVGPTAYVNVGSIIASTAGMTDQQFLSGQYHFQQDNHYAGAIINEGQIIAAQNGLIALLAPGVVNNGMIKANLGHVVLASGNAFTVELDGNQLVSFSVDKKTLTPGLNKNGQTLRDGVSNTGSIFANGGTVLVSAKTASGILDNVINMRGIVQAKSVGVKNGVIIISGDREAGVIKIAGELNANGELNSETGGSITISGHHILLESTANLSVNGPAGGGNINVGPNADAIVMVNGAALQANATKTGNGGHIQLFANDYTAASGLISAIGGATSGNGGFIETSSLQVLNIMALTVDTSAPHGNTGTWLLDPYDVTISNIDSNGSFSGGDPNTFTPTNTATIDAATLIANLATANVIITTAGAGSDPGDITVSDPITWTSTNSLTLTADNDIFINSAITGINGDLILNGVNFTIADTIQVKNATFNSSGTTTFNGGTVQTTADQTYGNMALSTNTQLDSSAGDIYIFGDLDGGSNTLTVNIGGTNGSLITGLISNLTAFTKGSSGSLIITNFNSYVGNTTIDGGILYITNSNSLGDDSNTIIINNTGTLAFSGFVPIDLLQNITLNNGGTILEEVSGGVNSISGNIAVTGTVSISVNGPGNDTLTLNGIISGTSITLNKDGVADLFINGNQNSFTGNTNINDGKLFISQSDSGSTGPLGDSTATVTVMSGKTLALGSNVIVQNNMTFNTGSTLEAISTSSDAVLSGNITLNGTVIIDVGNATTDTLTLSGILSGSSITLNKNGPGALTLSGINTYSSSTLNINTGKVIVKNSAALGASSSTAIIANGAQLSILNLTASAYLIPNAITINGTGLSGTGAILDQSTGQSNTLSGNITLDSDDSAIGVTNSGISLTIAGNIDNSSAYNWSKLGNGELKLSGTNTFGDTTHGLTITAGQVTAMSDNSLGVSTAPVVITTGSTLAIQGSNLTIANPISISGTGISSGGALMDISTSGTNTLSGTITLADTGTSISVTDVNGSLTLSGVISENAAGYTFNKVGSGLLTLSNVNVFTGATTVSAGTLNLNNNDALGTSGVHTSSVTVNDGATIKLTNANLSPSLPLPLSGNGVGGLGALLGSGTSSWNGNITLNDNTSIGTISGSDVLTLLNTVNGAYNLHFIGAGTITLNSTIGNSTALASLLADASLQINGASILTTGTQTYNNPVVIGANTTLTTANPAIIFSSTIDRSAGGAYTLDINAPTGGISLFGNVGNGVNGALGALTLNTAGATNLGGLIKAASLTTNVTGTTNISGPGITTTGNQSYGDNVSLSSSPTLKSGAGTINFAGFLSGIGFTLTLQDALIGSTGSVTVNGNINLQTLITFGGLANYAVNLFGSANTIVNATTFNNLGGVTLGNGSDTFNFSNGVTSNQSTTTLAATINTSNHIITLGTTIVAGNSILNSSGGNISLGAVDDALAGTHTLTLTATNGSITLNGDIGNSARLNQFIASNTGAANDLLITNNIKTTSLISLNIGRHIIISTGNLDSDTNVTLTANNAGAIQETGVGIITVGNLLTTTAATGITLTNVNNVAKFTASNSTSGNIRLTDSATQVLITGITQSASGAADVIINDVNGITVETSTSIIAGAHPITLDAGTGTLILNNGSLLLSTGIILLAADNYNWNAGAQIGGSALATGSASNVVLTQSSSTGISIGVMGGAGDLQITSAELGVIRANNLRIGNSTSGDITIAAWAPGSGFIPSGVLTFDSGSSIVQTGIIDLSANNAGLILRDAPVVTLTSNNVFSLIAANGTGNLSVTSASTSPLTVFGLSDDLGATTGISSSGIVTLTNTLGTITESSAIIQAPTLITSAVGGISLLGNNAISNFNASNSGATSSISLNNTIALNITGINQTATNGTLTITNTNGAITDSGTILVANGLTSLSATGSSNDITLNTATNNFSTVTVSNGANLTLADTNSIILGNITVTGATIITAPNGTITQSGTITGGTTLTTTSATGTILGAANQVTGFAATNTGVGVISLVSTASPLSINNITQSGTGNITINNTGHIVFGGDISAGANNVYLTSSSTITEGAHIVTALLLNATSVAGQTFSGNNAISSFNATNSGATSDISLNNTIALDITGINQTATAGTLTITNTTGAISDSGTILVANGLTSLSATGSGNDITLNTAANNFNTVTVTNGNNLTLADTNSIILSNITVTGATVISTPNGAITQTGAITDGTTLTTTTATGAILDAVNQVTGFSANNTGVGVINLINTASPLSINTITQTGTGDVIINNTGNIVFGGNISAGTNSVYITSSSTITEGAHTINAALLNATSVSGQTFSGNNTVSGFSASNSGTGVISLVNTASPLSINTITQTGTGDITISNTGNIIFGGNISAGANGVHLISSSTIAEGAHTITAALLNATSITGQAFGGNNAISSFNASNSGASSGISLNNTIALDITGINQTATSGTLTITNTTGAITDSGTISVANGLTSLSATGSGNNIILNNATNNFNTVTVTNGTNLTLADINSIVLGNITVSGATTIIAPNGAITQSGTITGGTTLTTSSANGTMLGAANEVTSFSATNSTSGNILFNNTSEPSTLDITGITQGSNGSVTVNNIGNLLISGNITTVGGDVTITTTTPDSNARTITVNGNIHTSDGLVNGGNIYLTADNPGNGIGMTINGLLDTSPGTGGALLIIGFIQVNQAPTVGQGNIILSAGSQDLIINNLHLTVNTTYNIYRYITVIGAITADPGVSLTLRGDSSNNGDGGVYIMSTGSINLPSGNLTLIGSKLTTLSGADATSGIQIASGATISVNGNISLVENVGTSNLNIAGNLGTTGAAHTVTLLPAVGGSILLSGQITSQGSTISMNGPVIISTTGTVDAANGAINFADQVTGGGVLSLQNGTASTGTVTFSKNISLGSLTTFAQAYAVIMSGATNTFTNAVTFNNSGGVTFGTSGNAFNFNGGITSNASLNTFNTSIVTSNDVANFGAITLNVDASITTGNGDINLSDVINGAHSLSLSSGTGSVTLGGIIGGTTPLTSIASIGSGTVTISGGAIHTSGNQNYNNVSLGATTQILHTSAGNIIIAGNVTGSNGAFTIDTGAGSTSSVNGSISAIASLSKAGSGTLTLGANSYTTTTHLTGGTLKLTTNTSLGTSAATLDASSGTTLELANINLTIPNTLTFNSGSTLLDNNANNSNIISGAVNLNGTVTINVNNSNNDMLTLSNTVTGTGATLSKTGVGKLVLSSANSFSGTTNFNLTAGALSLQNSAALGVSIATLALSGGTALYLEGNSAINIPAGITVNGSDGAGIYDNTTNGLDSFAGNFNLTGTTTIKTVSNTNTLTLSGTIASISLITINKIGAGELMLSGNSTFTGTVNVNSGSLILSSNNALGTADANVKSNTTLSLFGTSLSIGNNITLSNTSTLSDVNANGNNLLSGNITLIGSNTININGNANNTLTLSGILSGTTTTLNKTGVGKLIISHANTYTGTTNVNAGTLAIATEATALGTSTLNVNSGATFSLNNTLNGSLTNNIHLDTATLSNNGTNTLATGGLVLTNANTINSSGALTIAVSDVISGSGSLIVDGTGSLAIASTSTYIGSTTLVNGTLIAGNTTNSFGTGQLNLNGGILQSTTPVTLGNTSFTVGTNATTTINGNNNITLNTGTLNSGSQLNLSGSATITFNNGISGSGVINLSSGTAKFNGVNTSYTGNIALAGGNLQINNDNVNPLGTGTIALNGGTLTALTALTTNPLTNPFTLNSNTIIGGNNNINLSGNGTLNSGTLTITNTGTTQFSGIISGSGNLTETSANVILSGANTSYSGTTTLNGGSITINHNLALGSSAVNVNNGNLILNNVTLSNNSINLNDGTLTSNNLSTLGGALNLTDNTTNNTVFIGSGSTFTINNNINGHADLLLQGADGTSSMITNGEIGTTTPLASITVNVAITYGGTDTITTGDQIYNFAITLIADTKFISTGGSVFVNNTIDGNFPFTITSLIGTLINSAIGGVTPVDSVNISSNGTTIMNGGIITTVGTQTYGGIFQLNDDLTLTGSSLTLNNVTFNNNTNHALTFTTNNITANGSINFNVPVILSNDITMNATNSGTNQLNINNGVSGVGHSLSITTDTTGIYHISLSGDIDLQDITVTPGVGSNNNTLTLNTNSTTQTWNINSLNAGTVTGITGLAGTFNFSNIQSLIGGNQSDTFKFADNATVSGTVNGGELSSQNSLDYSAYTNQVTVTISNVSTGSGNSVNSSNVTMTDFTNINNLIANAPSNNTLIISSNNNQFTVTGESLGRIEKPINFSNISNFTATGSNNYVNFIIPATVNVIGNNIIGTINSTIMTFNNFTLGIYTPPTPTPPPTPVINSTNLMGVSAINLQPYINFTNQKTILANEMMYGDDTDWIKVIQTIWPLPLFTDDIAICNRGIKSGENTIAICQS